ncbi:hypothetical protein [Acinetobacter sp. Marseille-Q1618]|uniref:hypothetical protein n=1 Tax=Acinetobacter sp. Marseille-Q1618 TaxID=2697502 RepID=UPI0020C22FD7|nr:hypothetical protein [Acinetobacter sp. Marseille-Q1618]
MIKINILCAFLLFASFSVKANTLELRPLLKDRFEENCAIRPQYDFHNQNTDLIAPLKLYTTKSKYIDKQAYVSSIYDLKNVTYSEIPVRKIKFIFGHLAQQYNQYLYLDLSTVKAKKQFSKLKFKQNQKNTGLSVAFSKNIAIVQCYWLEQF